MFWCLEASKRGNDRVTSLQETNKKLLETLSELKKAASTASPSPSAPPMYPFPSELPGPDFFSSNSSASCCSLFPSKRGLKKKKKSEVIIALLRRNLLRGEMNRPQCLSIYRGPKQNLGPQLRNFLSQVRVHWDLLKNLSQPSGPMSQVLRSVSTNTAVTF